MTDIVNIVVLSFMVSCWVWRFLVVRVLAPVAILMSMSAVVGVVVSWRRRMVVVVFVLVVVWLLCVLASLGIWSRGCWFIWVHELVDVPSPHLLVQCDFNPIAEFAIGVVSLGSCSSS